MKAPLAVLILVSFLMTGIIGPMPVYAQTDEFRLPAPGVMVRMSPPFDPPILKGIKIHPDNPLRFDFILDKGDNLDKADDSLKQFRRLIDEPTDLDATANSKEAMQGLAVAQLLEDQIRSGRNWPFNAPLFWALAGIIGGVILLGKGKNIFSILCFYMRLGNFFIYFFKIVSDG